MIFLVEIVAATTSRICRRRSAPAVVLSAMIFLSLSTVLPALETTIKGDRMELLNKGEKVVFSGNVVLERGNDTLKAEEMTTTKRRDQVMAKGNVKLFRQASSTETWQGFGNSAFYNTETGAGYLTGKKGDAHIVRTEILSSTVTRRVDLWATRFDFNKLESSATAKGSVYGKTADSSAPDTYEFWSEFAAYDGTEKKLSLSGPAQPVVVQISTDSVKTLKGDLISYFIEAERLAGEGNAQAVLIGSQFEERVR